MTVKTKIARRGGMYVVTSPASPKSGRYAKTGVIVKGKGVRSGKTGAIVERVAKVAGKKIKVCNLNEFLVVTHVTDEDRKHAFRTGRFAEMTAKQAALD